MLYSELIQKAIEIAGTGGPPSANPYNDAAAVAEALMPAIFNQLATDTAADPDTRPLTRRIFPVSVVNGTATTDPDVFVQYLCDAMLYDPLDPEKEFPYIPNWIDLVRRFDVRQGGFHIDKTTMTIVEPDEEFDPSSGPTIDLTLITPSLWNMPLSPSEVLNIPAEMEDDLVNRLARGLRGEMK